MMQKYCRKVQIAAFGAPTLQTNDLPPTLRSSSVHHTWTVPEQTKDNTISFGYGM